MSERGLGKEPLALRATAAQARHLGGRSGLVQEEMKLLFLVLNRSEKEWTMPAREWSLAKAQFAILFGERLARAMA